MLRYEINTKDVEPKTVQLEIESYNIEDSFEKEDYLDVTCYYSNNINLTKDTVLHISSEYNAELTLTNEDVTMYDDFDVPIKYLNKEFRYFVFEHYKWYSLSLVGVNIVLQGNVPYLEFSFDRYHYFTSYADITFYAEFYNGTELIQKTFENCIFEDEYTLLWKYNADSPDIDLFMCAVFHNDTYEFSGYEVENEGEYVEYEEVPVQVCFSDDVLIKVREENGCDGEWRYAYYEKTCNDGDINGLNVYRDDFRLENFLIYFDSGSITIPLPISQMFDTRVEQEGNIKEHFIYDEIRNSINGFIEMEKFVYHPAFKVDKETPTFEDIYKIKFNLHFRKHNGDNWTVDDSAAWNGVYDNFSGFYDDVTNDVDHPFFSYNEHGGNEQDKSKQSDLVSYLGFTNADIKYQKNKVKKSFLRLSYYDSPNPIKQNLLAYATIFMDTGKLFEKYMTNVSDGNYITSCNADEGCGIDSFVGVKVNTERVYGIEDIPPSTNEEIEKHRLSTQFSVEDTFSSKASSEGFNLYLWADNDNGTIPSDIYLKVEFNHAGYGRTIPFMMPYKDMAEEYEDKGIKSFEDIRKDWSGEDFEHGHYKGYTMKKYQKYSYIHFKYCYDKEKEKRVYYLDPETYGDDAIYNKGLNEDASPNELEINLYEAKVNLLNNNDYNTNE